MTTHSFVLKKYASSISLSVLLLAIGGVIWLGILPLKKSLLNKARIIQEFYATEENQLKQVGRLPELKSQYVTITNDESTLDVLLSEGQIIEFIKTLETLASETNIELAITSKDNGKIVESKTTPEKTPGVIAKDTNTVPSSTTKTKLGDIIDDIPFDRYLRLNINATGQYSDIVNFLHKIETLPIGLDVIGVEMKRIDKEKQKKSLVGNGILSFGGSQGGEQTVFSTEDASAENVLEGVFDLLVYVNK